MSIPISAQPHRESLVIALRQTDKGLALDRQASAFVVREPNPLPLEFVLENPVFLLDVRVHVLLMPVHPAREGHEKELPCLKSVREPGFTRPRTLRLSP